MLGHDLVDASLEDIEAAGGDGLTRLRALIRAYAGVMTQQFGMCLVRLDEHELNPKALAQVRQRRRTVNQRFEDYRWEEQTSELQSIMRTTYAHICSNIT